MNVHSSGLLMSLLLAVASTAPLLSGCGQKGPLYIPQDEAPAPPPAAASGATPQTSESAAETAADVPADSPAR